MDNSRDTGTMKLSWKMEVKINSVIMSQNTFIITKAKIGQTQKTESR